MQSIRENRRFILIGLVVLVLLCLVGVLIYRIFFGGEEVVGAPTPTPIELTPTEEGPVVIVTPEEAAATPTPTRVVVESPTVETTTEPTEEATPPPTAAPPTSQPSPTPTISRSVSASTEVTTPPSRIEQLLQNGDFEAGFNDDGVARDWKSFKSDSVVAIFSPETAPPYVKSGSTGQRITVLDATQGDRYAGIYQQVNVVPNRAYTLTLNGQIRTGLGDVALTSYGYRMQYAIDYNGGVDWQKIPQEDWVELPWDEQLLNSSDVKFLNYTTTVTATSPKMTLFVRTWNKWPNPAEVQYTLDSLSLVGPAPVSGAATEEAMINQPLPTTGAGSGPSFVNDGRFWGAILVLLLLAGGAVFRARWEW